MRIGLPDSLRYQHYGPFWEAFMAALELEVVKPQQTLEVSLKLGAQLMPSEPPSIQLFAARTLELAQDVDLLLVPDLNPGVEPDQFGSSADPWAVDLAAVLSRRLSLPNLQKVPIWLGEDTAGLAVQLGQNWTRNAQLVRRALDRTQAFLKPIRLPEPRWARANHQTIGLGGEAALLEQPMLWTAAKQAFGQHQLHAVQANQLPRERSLELARKRRPNLSLETDLEVLGGALALEAKAAVQGLVLLVQANSPAQTQLAAEVVRKAHKPALLLELDAFGDLGTGVSERLEGFVAGLG